MLCFVCAPIRKLRELAFSAVTVALDMALTPLETEMNLKFQFYMGSTKPDAVPKYSVDTTSGKVGPAAIVIVAQSRR